MKPAWSALLMLAIIGSLGACAGSRERAADAGAGPGEAVPRVTARGVELTGLEVHVWRTDDAGGRATEALRVLAGEPLARRPDLGAGWNDFAAGGFSALALPADDLGEVIKALPPVGPLRRQMQQSGSALAPIVETRGAAGATPVSIGGRSVAVPSGRPMLLAEAVPVPFALPTRHVATALDTTLVAAVRTQTRAGIELEAPRSLDEVRSRGVTRLASTRATLEPNTLILLTAEDPVIDWFAPAADDARSVGPDARAVGPRVEGSVPLAEYVLGRSEAAGSTRTIVVIVPRAPARFSLVPGNR